MTEFCRRFACAINDIGRTVGLVLVIVVTILFWLWGGVDWLECVVKGAEYMASRGAVCP